MPKGKGKEFEKAVRESFEKIYGVSIDRIPDQTMKHKGATNICDFIVYKFPYQFYVECKSVHGNTLPFTNIKDNQWDGLTKKSQIKGVYAGVLCWWVDKDVTKFIPIQLLNKIRDEGHKSIRYDAKLYDPRTAIGEIVISGNKKRVYYDYDFIEFFSCFNHIKL